MLDRSYDVILSLGDSCIVAQNLRRRFRAATAYPFDWWVTRWPTICKLLNEDFAHLLELENLVIDQEERFVHCRHYGIVHAHDFLRDGSNRLVHDLAPQITPLREKFNYLIGRMDAATSNADVLAVRHRMHRDTEQPDPRWGEDRARALFERLARRWPTARLDLLVVDTGLPPADLRLPLGRIAFDNLEATGEVGDWQPKAWDRLLERQTVSLARRGGRRDRLRS